MKRYPGIKPFSIEYQELFKGREREIRELFELIVLNDILVLFGKSGTGKSSLLQAGLSPRLETRSLHPVFIRLINTQLSPEAQVYQHLKDENYIPSDLPAGLTLWEYFQYFHYVDLGDVFTPVVIFDQFEELFTLYSAEERKNFINQLAAIFNGVEPEEVQVDLASNYSTWKPQPKVRFILSIRSDYLFYLDELSSQIPAILSNRFQLKSLSRKNAKDAILIPAGLEGYFESNTFTFSGAAIDEILTELGKRHGIDQDQVGEVAMIEAFQLQVLCQYLENKIIAENRPPGFQIQPAFYGGVQGIQDIIEKFYLNVLTTFPENQQRVIQRALAEELIRNERRVMAEESVLKKDYALPEDTLDQLINERILRQEERSGILYYEISHDTLIKSILKNYEEVQKEQERKENRRRLLFFAGLAVLAIGIALGSFLLLKMQRTLNKSLKASKDEIKIQRDKLKNNKLELETKIASLKERDSTISLQIDTIRDQKAALEENNKVLQSLNESLQIQTRKAIAAAEEAEANEISAIKARDSIKLAYEELDSTKVAKKELEKANAELAIKDALNQQFTDKQVARSLATLSIIERDDKAAKAQEAVVAFKLLKGDLNEIPEVHVALYEALKAYQGVDYARWKPADGTISGLYLAPGQKLYFGSSQGVGYFAWPPDVSLNLQWLKEFDCIGIDVADSTQDPVFYGSELFKLGNTSVHSDLTKVDRHFLNLISRADNTFFVDKGKNLYQLPKGGQEKRLKKALSSQEIAYSAAYQGLFYLASDKKIKLYLPDNNQTENFSSQQYNAVSCLEAFQNWLVLGLDNGLLSLHEKEQGSLPQNKPQFRTLRQHKGRIAAADFYIRDTSIALLAAASYDGTVSLWDLKEEKKTGTNYRPVVFTDTRDWPTALLFEQTGEALIIGTRSGEIIRWEIKAEHYLPQLCEHLESNEKSDPVWRDYLKGTSLEDSKEDQNFCNE